MCVTYPPNPLSVKGAYIAQSVLAYFAEPQGRRRMSWGFRGWVTYISICGKHIELNLPRIAAQSILGFGRWRFGRVCKPPLLSPAAPVLCFTEQLSSFASNSNAISQWKIASASLSQARLAFCINTKKPNLLGLA